MNSKKESILTYGKFSPYWTEYTSSLPWDADSAECKLYVAGTLTGFSHDKILQLLAEQSREHASNFQNQGFFVWIEFFKSLDV